MWTGILFWLCVISVLYTYFGYPLLLGLVPNKKPPSATGEDYKPAVTLIIAAYNEETTIASKVTNSLELDYPKDRLQILIAADGSDDNTVAIAQTFSDRGVDIVFSPERKGKLAALTHAMESATGDIIVFSDANNMYGTDAVTHIVNEYRDPRVGAVTGAKHIIRGTSLLGESEGLYWRYESFIKERESSLGCCTSVCGEIFSLRRELYTHPTIKIINDDFFLAMNVIGKGYKLAYAPKAISYEHVSPTAQDEITRRARIIAGRYQFFAEAHHILPFNRPITLWQIVSHKILRPLVPFAMIGALLTNLIAVLVPSSGTGIDALLALGYPFNWILLGCQALFYGVAIAGGESKRSGKLGLVMYLPAFLFNSNWAALIGFLRFLKGSQTPIWTKVNRG